MGKKVRDLEVIRKETAQKVLKILGQHVSGIKDFDAVSVDNEILLTDAMRESLGVDMLDSLQIARIVNDDATKLDLSWLRLIAEQEKGASAAQAR
ncbi:MAG: hypothetical protein SFW63_02615 [Alphaproteobacteria bacterium]|nr:hypothetical protein [Alphaproteobacteria bacterium]